jgi:CheY-like chemotaxis protein
MINKRPKIYLVDDHKSFTFLTKHVVNKYFDSNCDIEIHEDPEDALELVITNPKGLDYLFLDLAMPKLNG